ncbi:MAG: GTP 3',8-cyclase [Hyphomicrobiaceae bacterium hypho_1]
MSHVPWSAEIVDPYNRKISYLRLSVTDRCNLRCIYCMAEGATFIPKQYVLTLDELDWICAVFIKKGVKKIRITGGEPFMRKNIITLFQKLGRHLKTDALHELAVTTNGSQLSHYARELFECGVRRINVSLDTLDQYKYSKITRYGDLSKVLYGLEIAKSFGLKIKINTVVLKGFNDLEINDLIYFAHDHGFDLTLIEKMPLGNKDSQKNDQYLSVSQLRNNLSKSWRFEDISYRSGGPASFVKVRETGGRLGFITPITNNFCIGCNRIRLSCTGKVYTCLGRKNAYDLGALIRTSTTQEVLDAAIDEAIKQKPKGHYFAFNNVVKSNLTYRDMNSIGG